MYAPAPVVARGEVEAEVGAARLLAPQRRARDECGDGQEVARRGPQRRARDLLELGERALERGARAQNPDALPHQPADALAHGFGRRAQPPQLFARSLARPAVIRLVRGGRWGT